MFDVKWRHCIASKTKENIKLFGQVKLFGIKHMTGLCPGYDVRRNNYDVICYNYDVMIHWHYFTYARQ